MNEGNICLPAKPYEATPAPKGLCTRNVVNKNGFSHYDHNNTSLLLQIYILYDNCFYFQCCCTCTLGQMMALWLFCRWFTVWQTVILCTHSLLGVVQLWKYTLLYTDMKLTFKTNKSQSLLLSLYLDYGRPQSISHALLGRWLTIAHIMKFEPFNARSSVFLIKFIIVIKYFLK